MVTGAQSEQNQGRPVPPLETSVPGVFAVGDVRSGSVKRVGGAIGEGAQVVAALHGFLGDAAKPALCACRSRRNACIESDGRAGMQFSSRAM